MSSMWLVTIALLALCSVSVAAPSPPQGPVIATGMYSAVGTIGWHAGGNGSVLGRTTIGTNDVFSQGVRWELSPRAVSWIFLISRRFPGFCWENCNVGHINRFQVESHGPLKFDPVSIDGLVQADSGPALGVSNVIHYVGRHIGLVGSQIAVSPAAAEMLDGATIVIDQPTLRVGNRYPGGFHYSLELYVAVYQPRILHTR